MKLRNLQKLFVCLLAVTALNAQTSRSPIVQRRLFGWADLHAHPASHLAFGSDANGDNGMFLGKPGGTWLPNYSNTFTDLPRCNYIHGGNDGDHVRHETHKALMKNLDEVGGALHMTADFGDNNYGQPSFEHWPVARSVDHQQMHITQIRRAYEGGQRMMVASVTDNEFLSDMWTKIGYNAFGNPVPAIDPDFGYKSAKKQITAIKKMVQDNSAWMAIAYTGKQARQIIDSDKLAIVLSVEMDSLTEAQILKLVDEDGVRQVIPIHLVNNNFGGAAVYNDAFNAVNNFLHSSRNGGLLNNDGFMKIVFDEKIDFHFGCPVYPKPIGGDLFQFDVLKGGAIELKEYEHCPDLGYKTGLGGHRNQLGLTSNKGLPTGIGFDNVDFGNKLIQKLAARGVLIDTAHMSARAVRDTLDLVTPWNYPVMSSHTGFRNADGTAESERALHQAHAQEIGALGGVVGLGTDWPEGFVNVLDQIGNNLSTGVQMGFNGQPRESRKITISPIAGDPKVAWLRIRMKTGLWQDLGTAASAIVTIDGKDYPYPLNRAGENWSVGTVSTVAIDLNWLPRSSKITSIRFKVNDFGWDISELNIDAVPVGADPVATWLKSFKEGMQLLGGKMAIGSDINGFAPQLWMPAEDVQYPIVLAHNMGPSRFTPVLQKATLGTRVPFDFKKDGIAHYGMLPDFLAAVSQQPESGPAIDQLFHSVDDVVTMWEKCDFAKFNVR